MAVMKEDWRVALSEEFSKDYYKKLNMFIRDEYDKATVYPPLDHLFEALAITSLADTKVVILGQDPYHDEGQAHGLCFSVKPGIATPRSLNNIYKEIVDDIGGYVPNNGYLEKWAKQGILMLNTVLTVRAHQAGSHRKKGWEQFTDAIIKKVNEKDTPVVFILWGKPAGEKASMIDTNKHLVLTSAHPSPLSARRGFFGCKHFSQTNDFLIANGMEPIDWQIENIDPKYLPIDVG